MNVALRVGARAAEPASLQVQTYSILHFGSGGKLPALYAEPVRVVLAA